MDTRLCFFLLLLDRAFEQVRCIDQATARLALVDERCPVMRAAESAHVTYEDQPAPRTCDGHAQAPRILQEAHVSKLV